MKTTANYLQNLEKVYLRKKQQMAKTNAEEQQFLYQILTAEIEALSQELKVCQSSK